MTMMEKLQRVFSKDPTPTHLPVATLFKPGVYLHHKTKSHYRVLFLATDSDNDAREPYRDIVVYVSLSSRHGIHTRPLKQFTEVVDGRPRFEYVGP